MLDFCTVKRPWAFVTSRRSGRDGNNLPLAFLLTFSRSLGFCSATHWCGRPRPSSSQLLPVWTGVKGQLKLVLTSRKCSPLQPQETFFFNLECVSSTSRRAEHVAFLPHALDVSYAVGNHGQIHRPGARGSRLPVLPLHRQSGGFKKWSVQICLVSYLLW